MLSFYILQKNWIVRVAQLLPFIAVFTQKFVPDLVVLKIRESCDSEENFTVRLSLEKWQLYSS